MKLLLFRSSLCLFVFVFCAASIVSAGIPAGRRERQRDRSGPPGKDPRSQQYPNRCRFRDRCQRKPNNRPNIPASNNPPLRQRPLDAGQENNKTQYSYGYGRGPLSTGTGNGRADQFALANPYAGAPQFFFRRFRPVVEPKYTPYPVGGTALLSDQSTVSIVQSVTEDSQATELPGSQSTTDDGDTYENVPHEETTTVDTETLRKQLFGW